MEENEFMDQAPDEEIVVEVARNTLKGDIRDFLLDRLKHDKSPLPWDAQPEAKQRETIQQAERAAEALIDSVARIVVAETRTVVHMALEQVVVKDGIKAVMNCPKSLEAMTHLGAAQGSVVAVVFLSTEHVQGQRRPRFATRDQPEMFDPETGEIMTPGEPTAPPPPSGPDTATPPPSDEPQPPSEDDGPKDEPEVARAKKRGRPPKAKD